MQPAGYRAQAVPARKRKACKSLNIWNKRAIGSWEPTAIEEQCGYASATKRACATICRSKRSRLRCLV